MLTRLKVNGFKNLVEADIRFGPFTCVAGPNGVGKSNLFDAIRFLSSLADKTFVDAAKCVRDESNKTGDVRSLFHQGGDTPFDRMFFEAEMIVPKHGVDQLGLPVKATKTFLRYTLELGLVQSGPDLPGDRLELIKEELTYVKNAHQLKSLPFGPAVDWFDSAVWNGDTARRSAYISTKTDEQSKSTFVYMHTDGSTHSKTGRPVKQLSRTLLSATTSLESPTAAVARLEMQSWRLLQLEPSSLRAPDEFDAERRLESNGAHLPATLYRLAHGTSVAGNSVREQNLYARVSLRLNQLIEDIRELDVDRDEKRQLLTLVATDRLGARLPARSLSDGTLRFLALSVLEEDEEAVGVLCFEEPENGIHPARIEAMLRLLQDIAVDTKTALGAGNPLRQVIVNTHSPLVVKGVPEDSLLCAVSEEYSTPHGLVRRVNFLPLSGTWRCTLKPQPRSVPLVELNAYLTPILPSGRTEPSNANGHLQISTRVQRVGDRADVKLQQQSFQFEPGVMDAE